MARQIQFARDQRERELAKQRNIRMAKDAIEKARKNKLKPLQFQKKKIEGVTKPKQRRLNMKYGRAQEPAEGIFVLACLVFIYFYFF